jgi:outer membrane protein assembly factor BamB
MLALLVVSFSWLPSAIPATDTWPQWRGPAGDSIAPGPGLPVQFGPGKNEVWKTQLPGWGDSTPAIWDSAIFVTSQDDDRLLLLRLDRESGKIAWQREVGRGKPRRAGPVGNGKFNEEHNMATPSPVTDGRHVWVHFVNGDLACYDYSGKEIWKQNLTERFGPYTIWWGHANSPVLVGDLLISACMQDPKGGGRSYVVAQDKETGKERWFSERATGATSEPADAYTTPILYQRDGRTQLIVFGGNVLDGYDPANGRRLWHCGVFKGNRVISGPTLAGDTVYAVQGMRGPLFAVRADGMGDVTDSHVSWKYGGGTPDAANPLVYRGLVFLATNPGQAVCLDAAGGKELWKERLGRGFRASPLGAGGKVYFVSKEGKVSVVEAARSFQLVAQTDLKEDIVASPAAAHGDLFLRTKGHLYRFGTKEEASRGR